MKGVRARVLGWGSYLPERIVTNDDLARQGIDTSDDWIVERTGIRRRHIAAAGECTSDLALRAAKRALARAGIGPAEIDLIVLATTTPDNTFPATATKVQAALGMTGGAAFDLQAVCAGFIYALAVANNFIRVGQAETVLVIGAETFSRILDWSDRATCVLFGDGAGALVLGRSDGADGAPGILSTHIHSDGRRYGLLYVDGGPSSTGEAGHVRMKGREVFRLAVTLLAEAAEEALGANALSADDIAWLIPHQANKRIIDATARKLGLGTDRVITTVHEHANTSAASIPLALATAADEGRFERGQILLLEGLGGGFAWGSAVVRW